MHTILVLLCSAASSGGLEDEVEHYVDLGSPRFSRHGAHLSIRVNVWMPVLDGDVRIGDLSYDLRDGLDVGELDHGYEGLYAPAIGAAIGSLFSLKANSPEGLLVGIAGGAIAGVVLAPAVIDSPVEFVAQWTPNEFGVRGDGFVLGYDTDDDEAADATFDLAQIRVVGMWTFFRTPANESPVFGGRDSLIKPHGVAWSLLAGGAWTKAESKVGAAPSAGTSAVLPQLGVLFEGRAGDWGFEVQLAGGAVPDHTWWDVRASVAYCFTECFGARMGYRYVAADLSDADFDWSGSLHGFFFGVSFHF